MEKIYNFKNALSEEGISELIDAINLWKADNCGYYGLDVSVTSEGVITITGDVFLITESIDIAFRAFLDTLNIT